MAALRLSLFDPVQDGSGADVGFASDILKRPFDDAFPHGMREDHNGNPARIEGMLRLINAGNRNAQLA